MNERGKLGELAGALIDWKPSSRSFWLRWAVIAAVLVAAVLPTLKISPPIWGDEVHIIEYGRLFFDPGSNWSMSWQAGRPTFPWYFLGTVMQFLAERATAPSCLGSRLTALAGSLLASGMLSAWLLRRQTIPAAALLIGFLFWLDPAFVAGYRGDRIDGWAFAWIFAACCLLGDRTKSPTGAQVAGAGAASVLAFLTWPSAALLFPLVALELARAVGRTLVARRTVMLVSFVGGALAALLLVEGPAVYHSARLAQDVSKMLAVTGTTTPGRFKPSALAESVKRFILNIFVLSPWCAPLLLATGRSSLSRPTIVLAGLLGLLMIGMGCYVHRLVYLLPYLASIYADGFVAVDRAPRFERRPKRFFVLGSSVLCALAISIGLRSANAWSQRASRSEARLLAAARQVAPAGTTVCLQVMELYFAGRAQGWRMFGTAKGGLGLTVDELPNCEIAIVYASNPPEELRLGLEAAGFRPRSVLLSESAQSTHAYGGQGYGPYTVYQRSVPTGSANGPDPPAHR